MAEATEEFRAAPNTQTAQKLVALYNARYHTTGTSNFPLDMPITYPQSPEAVERLTAPERLLYARRMILQEIASKNITVDPYAMPTETPIRTIGREQLRTNLNEYYNILAEKKPGVFSDIYVDQVGGRQPNLDDVDSRRTAVSRFVDSLEIVRDMPVNGVPMEEFYRHISTQSREVPGDARRNNFNDVENFRIDPENQADGSCIASCRNGSRRPSPRG